MSTTIEVCAASLESVEAAVAGGAQRVELCQALGEGGVTPSLGMLREARQARGIRQHVLIRPRGGDFLYTRREQLAMLTDIGLAAELGMDGVVVGSLTAEGEVDVPALREMVRVAGPMSVTFHRAFDVCCDRRRALEQLIDAGVSRVLTSGGEATALAGIDALQALVRQSAGRISVMPGCGVTAGNAVEILRRTGATELHASCKGVVQSPMRYRNPRASMGEPGRDEYSRLSTSLQAVRELVQAVSGM